VLDSAIFDQTSLNFWKSLFERRAPDLYRLINDEIVLVNWLKLLILLADLFIKIHIYLGFSVGVHDDGIPTLPNRKRASIDKLFDPDLAVMEDELWALSLVGQGLEDQLLKFRVTDLVHETPEQEHTVV